jgi:hypothetical protein
LNLTPPQQDCCPGNGCARVTTRTESSCLGCAPVTRYDVVSCSGSSGQCKSPNFRAITCVVEETGFEYLCNDVTFSTCGTTPSQTPIPTATSCPQVFPYQCPSGIPVDTCANDRFLNTGCPVNYQPSEDGKCCMPLACPSPIPPRPDCDHDLIFYDYPICRWQTCVTLPPPPPPIGYCNGLPDWATHQAAHRASSTRAASVVAVPHSLAFAIDLEAMTWTPASASATLASRPS